MSETNPDIRAIDRLAQHDELRQLFDETDDLIDLLRDIKREVSTPRAASKLYAARRALGLPAERESIGDPCALNIDEWKLHIERLEWDARRAEAFAADLRIDEAIAVLRRANFIFAFVRLGMLQMKREGGRR